MQAEQRKLPWPTLREELTLYPGPADGSGAPTWTIHDPARNQYFQIDWIAFEIISRLALGDAQAVIQAVNETTTLHIDDVAVDTVVKFLNENDLVFRASAEESQFLYKRYQLRSKDWFEKILHGYLFFRVPLFKPDRLLERILPLLRFIFTRRFLEITGVVLLVGFWGVYRQWQTFQATLLDTFSLEGLLGYAGALIFIKIFHEFGHAVVAKKCGCRVPTMGLAFLVMWPVAYTDVTESWKLDSNKKRLYIASAGILTELIVAAWAIFLWGFLPDGALKNVLFFLGTTSIVATLVINASPFMRFDGYFLLCDILGMPNLHSRSFAYTRWWLRESLFGLQDPEPEPLTDNQKHFFIIFAIATWIYRLVVFAGIALLVYHYFFKALGILLFLVEIWFFIAQPVIHELRLWHKRWPEIAPVVRHRPAFYIALAALFILLVPFDLTVNSQGMLKPEISLHVVTAQPVQVTKLPPPIGTVVTSGQQIIGLNSLELDKKIKRTEVRIDALNRQYGSAGFDSKTISQQPILFEQLKSAQEEMKGLLKEKARLNQVATFDGVVVDSDPDLFVGEWIPKATPLVTLIDERHWVVDCYVEESDLKRLDKGNWGRFIPDGQGLKTVGLSIISIEKDATHVLRDGALANLSHGEIMVREQNKKLIPEHAIYRVRLKVDGNPGKIATGNLRGRVTILAWPKSLFGDAIRGFLATVVRELGF